MVYYGKFWRVRLQLDRRLHQSKWTLEPPNLWSSKVAVLKFQESRENPVTYLMLNGAIIRMLKVAFLFLFPFGILDGS